MYYYDFLRQVHARLSPQAYLEVGIRNGGSLAKICGSLCRAASMRDGSRRSTVVIPSMF